MEEQDSACYKEHFAFSGTRVCRVQTPFENYQTSKHAGRRVVRDECTRRVHSTLLGSQCWLASSYWPVKAAAVADAPDRSIANTNVYIVCYNRSDTFHCHASISSSRTSPALALTIARSSAITSSVKIFHSSFINWSLRILSLLSPASPLVQEVWLYSSS